MTTRSPLRAGDAAVEVLARAGVRRFYTVPGESGAAIHVEHGFVADPRAALTSVVAQAPSSKPARDWSSAHRAYLDSSSIPAGRTADVVTDADLLTPTSRLSEMAGE
jgi:hypothetical protein